MKRTLVAIALSVGLSAGLLGITATSAQAKNDTTWGCPGC